MGLLAQPQSRTLHGLIKATDGLKVMTPELEDMATRLLTNEVPASWAKAAYPSTMVRITLISADRRKYT